MFKKFNNYIKSRTLQMFLKASDFTQFIQMNVVLKYSAFLIYKYTHDENIKLNTLNWFFLQYSIWLFLRTLNNFMLLFFEPISKFCFLSKLSKSTRLQKRNHKISF
ncbi:hypothetical protein EDEG_00089 [Edhazardia aedis USNM 41457]|uniref:Uncharacterized protein n=1 Tax=Edhazardia aedis (strain USNM 41457) TaxID=1003232 RepID=J9DUJ5_EDHAE|nr:hypothetical protein EDEG_00089 [Edhazardia aedis USNM 41457]|eukprot:EJW04972.1 hypothetical protein EDEG_00089 [Edhazardia aedis USNM 41457]